MNEVGGQPESSLGPETALDIMKKGLVEKYANSQEDFGLVLKGFANLQEIATSPMSNNKKLPKGSFNQFLTEVSDIFIQELQAIKANRVGAHSVSGGGMEETSLIDQYSNAIDQVEDLIETIRNWQTDVNS